MALDTNTRVNKIYNFFSDIGHFTFTRTLTWYRKIKKWYTNGVKKLVLNKNELPFEHSQVSPRRDGFNILSKMKVLNYFYRIGGFNFSFTIQFGIKSLIQGIKKRVYNSADTIDVTSKHTPLLNSSISPRVVSIYNAIESSNSQVMDIYSVPPVFNIYIPLAGDEGTNPPIDMTFKLRTHSVNTLKLVAIQNDYSDTVLISNIELGDIINVNLSKEVNVYINIPTLLVPYKSPIIRFTFEDILTKEQYFYDIILEIPLKNSKFSIPIRFHNIKSGMEGRLVVVRNFTDTLEFYNEADKKLAIYWNDASDIGPKVNPRHIIYKTDKIDEPVHLYYKVIADDIIFIKRMY